MMPTRRQFELVGSNQRVLTLPQNRGQLWYDDQIAEEFFVGLPGIANKVRWVREHLPRETRVKVGRRSAWYASDILAWLEARRGADWVSV
jgi:hypothetical protein